jgi:hypothetical protein
MLRAQLETGGSTAMAQATSGRVASTWGRLASATLSLTVTLVLLCLSSKQLLAQTSLDTQLSVDPGTLAELESGEEAAPTSTEQGVTSIDESFDARALSEWIVDSRRQGFADTRFNLQIRSYFLDRDRFDGSESAAWALGGSAGLRTGYFRDRVAFGATAYTSQRLAGDLDKDGTALLAPGQQGYSVLGELYGEMLLTEGITAAIGRKGFDSPYIGRNDSRMTPNTFEMVGLQGLLGDGSNQPQWRFGLGYFDRIKERNSEDFVSMAQDAGAPEGIRRGVHAAGVSYKQGEFTIGAVNYYSDDIINIFYTEAKYALPLREAVKLQLALQYTDQRSTGDELLEGGDFSSDQFGLKTELVHGRALYTIGYTGTGNGSNMRSPWSGYPGYTRGQVENFNRAGENAWMLRVGYNLPGASGWRLHALYVDGARPNGPGQFARKEYNLNAQWAPQAASLRGLSFRLRYARVEEDGPARRAQDEFRLIINYDPPRG